MAATLVRHAAVPSCLENHEPRCTCEGYLARSSRYQELVGAGHLARGQVVRRGRGPREVKQSGEKKEKGKSVKKGRRRSGLERSTGLRVRGLGFRV
eukprot:1551792-Rhodomonas_salina.1